MSISILRNVLNNGPITGYIRYFPALFNDWNDNLNDFSENFNRREISI